VIKGLTKRKKLSNGKQLNYANGLEVSSENHKYKYIFHGGGFEGFLTDLIKVPSKKASFIYLSNNNAVGYTQSWYRKYF